MFCSSGVRNGDTAPFAKLLNKLLVNTALQALVIGRMDQELRAV